jgi:hypothetical protein
MNELELVLYNTRKSVLEGCRELGYNYSLDDDINLLCCTSCGIWLKYMMEDLDGNNICKVCYNTYGP